MNKRKQKNFATKESPKIYICNYQSGKRRIVQWYEHGKIKWEYYYRWLWEKEKGEIPKGYCVHHKDGNPLNDCIENYELMRNKDHSIYHIRR